MAKITIDPNKYQMLDDERQRQLAEMENFKQQQAPVQQDDVSSKYAAVSNALAQQPQQTGSTTGNLANLGGSMALAAGNPALGGALLGAGLVLGARQKRKDAEYQAKLARITAMQNSLQYLGQMSQGLAGL